ncbi:MAG TPA: TA system VapC family ribonuclease toxin [Candidatus Aquilonibacter sp.]|nr:TA system VapC family ribonuclease toxin [Candidatus Aquilonibacter sp.]
MRRSTTLFLFPDTNVWVALTYERHVHHIVARRWFDGLEPTVRLFFCRFTQLGLLRLLTAEAVMGVDGVKNQQAAWTAYDTWLEDDRIEIMAEPADLETHFRTLSRSSRPAPKDWADSYLAAFALAGGLTVVTLDSAFQIKFPGAVLLRA